MRKTRKNRWVAAVLMVCIWGLCSCVDIPPGAPEESTAHTAQEETEKEQTLTFDGRRYAFCGDADSIRASHADVTVVRGGRYRVSGTLKEGTLTVDAPRDETVTLVLDGVSITSSGGAPLCLLGGASVVVESTRGSVNLLSDTETEGSPDAPSERAALYADCDLIVRGEGSLVVSGKRACAVYGTGNILIESGQLTLSAPEDAIFARDRFFLSGGRVSVTEAGCGVRVGDGARDAGEITVEGGTLALLCRETALYATRAIRLTGGEGTLRAKRNFLCETVLDGQRIEGRITVAQNWLKKT